MPDEDVRRRVNALAQRLTEGTGISLTELPQFGRIVEFLGWCRTYADETCDGPLTEQLDILADDLREMRVA